MESIISFSKNSRSRGLGVLDRIDLQVEVPALNFDELRETRPAEPSSAIRARVNTARKRQLERGVDCNAHLSGAALRKSCQLDSAGEKLMKTAYDAIQCAHLAEAIQYRTTELLSRE